MSQNQQNAANKAMQNWEDESAGSKFGRKAQESPFMVVGLVGLIAACGIGAYKFKNRGKTSTSLFLIQLRVAAQGTVVGCLALGVCHRIYTRYILGHVDED